MAIDKQQHYNPLNITTMTKKSSKVNNETKVMCPVCGSEFAIGEHEHHVKDATVIGQDSGLGDVFLQVSKRGDALKAAGIDTGKYFSINLPTGGSQMMKMDDEGKAVPVTADDPIVQAIINGGTVPNKNLFRRWIMSQTFHGLMANGGYAKWLKWHGYIYTWEMLVKELHDQTKLAGRDAENFNARNRWYNLDLCVAMANDYIKQVKADAKSRKTHKCKGVPYIKFDRKNIFVADIEKKIVWPLVLLRADIARAKNPQQLYEAVKNFWQSAYSGSQNYKQATEWKDAYRGSGAYFTMQNLLRFHGCSFPKDNQFYLRNMSGLQMLENAANAYANGEGWRLFGLMKQMINENGIDIEAKMKQWAAAKEAKRLRR